MRAPADVFAAVFATLAIALPHQAIAQSLDFGDDTSTWANDGECDDSRFEGSGMTDTILLDVDIGHDAGDCRIAFDQKRITLKGVDNSRDTTTGIDVPIASINFGNDEGDWPNDGECDDVRFVGKGMSDSLVTDWIGRDVSDCLSAFEAGTIQLSALFADPTAKSPIDFGDNNAGFANDGECDDIRFTGDYASEIIYLAEDIGHDANDCRAAIESGAATWQGKTATPNYGMKS